MNNMNEFYNYYYYNFFFKEFCEKLNTFNVLIDVGW